MSQRFLKIKNFKNIGITKEEDQWERLYLNNSLDKDKIGELIILIGENNVGKSNILDAINIISLASKSKKSQNFKNCIPDFMGYNDCLPKLKLVYKDDENNSYDLELSINENGSVELINSLPKDTKIIKPQLTLDKITEEFKSKFSSYTKEIMDYGYTESLDIIKKDYDDIINSEENINTKYETLKESYIVLNKFFKDFIDDYNNRVYYNDRKIKHLKFIDLEAIAYTEQKEVETYKDTIKEKYDIDFIPNIVLYEEKHIKDEDLITTPEKIKDSKFFNSLFKAINYKTSIIATAYEKAKINPGYKDQYQDDINKKLKDIVSKRFNELYYQALGTQEYSFEIKLEKDEIYLSMKQNGNIITLAQQSVGFKWFFNFFFNFLYTDELKAGDIVLMDEPEIHLSIPGRRDLRKFIKKFAKDTGITFIATTHNPSFADIDYLDELRIIKNNKDGIGVKIQSNFSALADNEVDTLGSIINSFGILRSDLTREYKIIFVEGITDYNYLTAFKLLYNKDKEDKKEYDKKLNIVFIPIYGLGKDDNEMEKKLDKLIQFKDAILLTDGDTRGNAFKKLCDNEKLKGRLTVIQLTEIENSFKNIENLFAQSDKEKYKNIIEDKGIEKSSPFKNSIAQLELDAKTIENFNKVLKYLNEMS
ncbi:AAA family ATPase [uncultured Brachyspira sp.]|uniref:AAA family ATPase n=1 Tax=uncultured Brachyspira sp. TaxID=221953 RepID=UPI00259BD41F|nr:AAA family ATPase [uncultured Brachyspira sp.]